MPDQFRRQTRGKSFRYGGQFGKLTCLVTGGIAPEQNSDRMFACRQVGREEMASRSRCAQTLPGLVDIDRRHDPEPVTFFDISQGLFERCDGLVAQSQLLSLLNGQVIEIGELGRKPEVQGTQFFVRCFRPFRGSASPRLELAP